jgi:hypothetical protein
MQRYFDEYKNKKYTDFVVTAVNAVTGKCERIDVHKHILFGRCSYFSSLHNSKNLASHHITAEYYDVVNRMIEYVYTSVIKFTSYEDLLPLTSLAEFWGLNQDMMNKLKKFVRSVMIGLLNNSLITVIDAISLCETYVFLKETFFFTLIQKKIENASAHPNTFGHFFDDAFIRIHPSYFSTMKLEL